MGNLNLRQPARHLSRFENGNWGFFVVISKPIFPISPSGLCCPACSPDYDSAQISYSLHTSGWIQRNGQNDHISNLEIYSFMLGNCIAPHGSFLHRWPLSEVEMVVGGGGPYGFASTVYRLSNFHARSQFTPNNVSKHSGAIFHTRPDDCSYRFLVREAINWGQRRRFGLCSNCSTTEKTWSNTDLWVGLSKKWQITEHLEEEIIPFFRQLFGCQSPDNILIRISIKSAFNWFPNADHVFDWLSYGGNPIFALLTTSSGLKMIRKEFYFQIKRRPFGTMADLRFQEGSPWNDWISTGRIFWPN